MSVEMDMDMYGYTCKCCGQVMHSKYYSDGFIAHVLNFSNKFDSIIKYPKDKIVEAIAIDGNDYRSFSEIRDRFRCFKIYCEKTGYINNNKSDFDYIQKSVEDIVIRKERLQSRAKEAIKMIHKRQHTLDGFDIIPISKIDNMDDIEIKNPQDLQEIAKFLEANLNRDFEKEKSERGISKDREREKSRTRKSI